MKGSVQLHNIGVQVQHVNYLFVVCVCIMCVNTCVCVGEYTCMCLHKCYVHVAYIMYIYMHS